MNGAGPFSKVRYGKTVSKEKKEKKKNPSKLKTQKTKIVESNEKKVEDKDATLYLIIGNQSCSFMIILFFTVIQYIFNHNCIFQVSLWERSV